MEVSLKNMQGQVVDTIELPDSIFASEINQAVMHQALVRQLSNRRQGTHNTKTRSDVRGGGRKPWRQKGTGRARQGSTRAPHWRGGGVVFGPHPRSYTQKMPRKMRRLALRSALSIKAQDQQVVVLDDLAVAVPRTKDIAQMLAALNVERSALVLLPGRNTNVELAARNLPNVKTLHATYLNVRDILGYDTLILPQQTLSVLESFLGDEVYFVDVEDFTDEAAEADEE